LESASKDQPKLDLSQFSLARLTDKASARSSCDHLGSDCDASCDKLGCLEFRARRKLLPSLCGKLMHQTNFREVLARGFKLAPSHRTSLVLKLVWPSDGTDSFSNERATLGSRPSCAGYFRARLPVQCIKCEVCNRGASRGRSTENDSNPERELVP
jgi:hypothetical protein